ncbi:hypothetical protein LWP59_18040 [Amycolatopsis acidiphila]|uniref:Rv1733c family protein n=1 Tax=Amycolatopsis acidiphila TaxID=715473 RepID=UPI001643AB8B|nr:hypothetical protein [Amycolatopsis acidiphila]UIJ63400.1 hypothetical protein LWP59_18040 [Amycolatopsis acidiphila]
MRGGSGNWPARQLRLLRPGRSALARRWDRIEAVLALLAIGLCLAAIPVAAAAGADVYREQSALARQQGLERHPAIAIIQADAPEAPLTDIPSADEQVQAPATWTGADGLDRTAPIWVEPVTPAGSAQPIWLDRNDDLTTAPAGRATVLGSAVGAALAAGICCVAAALGGLAAGRLLLNRGRAASWTREWERFSGRPSRS